MELGTRYMGLELRCPLVASAGPTSQTMAGMMALADAGVGAVTMHSLFEEQILAEQTRQFRMAAAVEDTNPEGLSYFPSVPIRLPWDQGSAGLAYLKLLEAAAGRLDIPVVASLNASTPGSWSKFAHQMEEAGASAIELNVYYVPGDEALTSQEVENLHIDIVGAVKSQVGIPVAVKLSPYFSSFTMLAHRLEEAGADGLVLFNRFLQPDIDLETLQPVQGLELSHSFEARVPRTWISILRNQLGLSLAATSGVETADDLVKYILVGADVVCTTSALVRHGPAYAADLIAGLESWLERHGYGSVDEARGLLAVDEIDPSSYERHGYVAALQTAKQRYASLAGL